MGSIFSSTPLPNLFDQKYNHNEINLWKGQREILPQSSGGPLNLGDPDDRSLSEEELKVIIPRRMYRTCKETMCFKENEDYDKCWKDEGSMALTRCDKKPVKDCMDNMFASPQFRLAIAREYLDERSHNRQTGQRTPRYLRSNWVSRLPGDIGMDANGAYIPRKPLGWSEAYAEGEPSWAGTGPTGVEIPSTQAPGDEPLRPKSSETG